MIEQVREFIYLGNIICKEAGSEGNVNLEIKITRCTFIQLNSILE
jgi:hypothetical protein